MWKSRTREPQSLLVGFLLAIFGSIMLLIGWLRWAF